MVETKFFSKRAVVLGVSSFILLVLLLLGVSAFSSLNESVFTDCLVTDKDRTTSRDGSDMRIYSSCGIFQVSDNLFKGITNSSDIYGSIKVGTTYDFVATGFRIPLASTFPDIIKATESSVEG